MALTLVTGGARSGKSSFAVHLASRSPRVVFAATLIPEDDEMRSRAEAHRRARPDHWETTLVDYPLEEVFRRHPQGTVLVDCLTLYVSRLVREKRSEQSILDSVERFSAEAAGRETVAVTNEVGWGVVPESPLGRIFRDIAGRANQVAASRAEAVALMVCGIPVWLKSNSLDPKGRTAAPLWAPEPAGR